MRKGKASDDNREVVHLLESGSRSHKLVTRNVFSSETLAACDTAADLISLSVTMHEVVSGSSKDATEALQLQTQAKTAFYTELGTDSMSLLHGPQSHRGEGTGRQDTGCAPLLVRGTVGAQTGPTTDVDRHARYERRWKHERRSRPIMPHKAHDGDVGHREPDAELRGASANGNEQP